MISVYLLAFLTHNKINILKFVSDGFHGRTLGSLSTTHTKYIHKIDVPSFKWPAADFPHYKYPLEANERENKLEDEKCLAQVSAYLVYFC